MYNICIHIINNYDKFRLEFIRTRKWRNHRRNKIDNRQHDRIVNAMNKFTHWSMHCRCFLSLSLSLCCPGYSSAVDASWLKKKHCYDSRDSDPAFQLNLTVSRHLFARSHDTFTRKSDETSIKCTTENCSRSIRTVF